MAGCQSLTWNVFRAVTKTEKNGTARVRRGAREEQTQKTGRM